MFILLWSLHMATLSALGYRQSGEWGGLSFPISRPLGEGRRAASLRPMFTENLVCSGFPYSSETIGGSCAVLSMLPLYSDIICEFLQIIDD